jgi:Holliday junction resolvasome RuvABC ATP-dependent DNA helicase subunit
MSSTFAKNSDLYKFSLGEYSWNLIVDTLKQSSSESVAKTLLAEVSSDGRYIPRAPRGQRISSNERKQMDIDSLEGLEKYNRPNGEAYYARKWGIHSDVEVLKQAREHTSKRKGSALFGLLYGAPGCGKTALVEAAFPDDVYTIMGTGDTEVADLVGGYIQNEAGGFEWIDGDLVKAAELGGVYFIDEVGLIDPKVLSVVYGLMDGRREITVTANPERGTVKAHPNFYVVAATNPNAPGVRLSEALLSRFTLQVEMTTDWELAKKLGVSNRIVTAAMNLAKKQSAGEVSWAPQMRELIAFREVSELYGVGFAISNLLALAPEMDRPVVTDVLTRVYAEDHRPARI